MLEFYGPYTIEFYLRKKQYNETLTKTNKYKWPTKSFVPEPKLSAMQELRDYRI